ncbi:hypothetical protein MKX64_17420 [Paenibacillus sp. FSL M8-0334]|uniref:hypothetical protein n=1 Tax=Paenibacillus sp. FSL M8-0334 TaxID=2921623 RepID=UPI0030F86E01
MTEDRSVHYDGEPEGIEVTYLAILCMNILLGIYVPYILIYALVVNRSKGRGRSSKPKKDWSSVKSVVGTTVFCCAFFRRILGAFRL